MGTDEKELMVQCDSDDHPAVTHGHSNESETPFCPYNSPSTSPQNRGEGGHAGSCVGSSCNEQPAPGGKLWQSLSIRRHLRLCCRVSSSCHSKELFFPLMKTEHFTLWEICSFCLCFCPHRMFLSAPCKGTGNYRALHLHPHDSRQIL